jgi:hypothetical protein
VIVMGKSPSKETIAKRVAGQKRNRARRKRMQEKRLRGDGKEAAAERLSSDGCYGRDAIQRRIRWLAHERNLPPCEIAKALMVRQYDLVQFIERHNLSYDWLLCGDLKGLARMPVKRAQPIFTAADLITCYNRLGVSQRIRATKILGEMRPNDVEEA